LIISISNSSCNFRNLADLKNLEVTLIVNKEDSEARRNVCRALDDLGLLNGACYFKRDRILMGKVDFIKLGDIYPILIMFL